MNRIRKLLVGVFFLVLTILGFFPGITQGVTLSNLENPVCNESNAIAKQASKPDGNLKEVNLNHWEEIVSQVIPQEREATSELSPEEALAYLKEIQTFAQRIKP